MLTLKSHKTLNTGGKVTNNFTARDNILYKTVKFMNNCERYRKKNISKLLVFPTILWMLIHLNERIVYLKVTIR